MNCSVLVCVAALLLMLACHACVCAQTHACTRTHRSVTSGLVLEPAPAPRRQPHEPPPAPRLLATPPGSEGGDRPSGGVHQVALAASRGGSPSDGVRAQLVDLEVRQQQQRAASSSSQGEGHMNEDEAVLAALEPPQPSPAWPLLGGMLGSASQQAEQDAAGDEPGPQGQGSGTVGGPTEESPAKKKKVKKVKKEKKDKGKKKRAKEGSVVEAELQVLEGGALGAQEAEQGAQPQASSAPPTAAAPEGGHQEQAWVAPGPGGRVGRRRSQQQALAGMAERPLPTQQGQAGAQQQQQQQQQGASSGAQQSQDAAPAADPRRSASIRGSSSGTPSTQDQQQQPAGSRAQDYLQRFLPRAAAGPSAAEGAEAAPQPLAVLLEQQAAAQAPASSKPGFGRAALFARRATPLSGAASSSGSSGSGAGGPSGQPATAGRALAAAARSSSSGGGGNDVVAYTPPEDEDDGMRVEELE